MNYVLQRGSKYCSIKKKQHQNNDMKCLLFAEDLSGMTDSLTQAFFEREGTGNK